MLCRLPIVPRVGDKTTTSLRHQLRHDLLMSFHLDAYSYVAKLTMQRATARLAYLLIALAAIGNCNGLDDCSGESDLALSYVYLDGSRAEDEGNYYFPEMWFNQVLDHTNKLNRATWKQRYFVNSQYYKKDGPIFLIVSGESPAISKLLVDGYVAELAEKYSALCFILEHRYYGKSQPKPHNVKDKKSMIYLTSNQVLMDTAHFINRIRPIHNITSSGKWILFGSSYAGTLVTWMRVKFPHLVYGSVAQSAPLVATVDYPNFFQFIHDTVEKHSPGCLSTISDAFREFFVTLHNPEGRKNLQPVFSLCNSVAPKNIVLELNELYEWFLSEIYYVISNRMVSFPDTCKMMMNDSYSSLENLAFLDNQIRNWRKVTCIPPKREIQDDDAAWWYQICTQFGWFQTTSSKPFNIFAEILPVDKYLKKCARLIGPSYLSTLELGVEHTNLVYGGLNIIKETSNIIFIHGENDPWMSVSLKNSTNPKVSVIIVNGSGHVPFSYTPVENNSNEIRKAKQQLEILMFSWLRQ